MNSSININKGNQHNNISDRIFKKSAWHLMPLLLMGYLLANIDRINIGFAKVQMSGDLGFSETTYGLGAGMFFLGYIIFGVPSNIVMDKIGPRRWIAILMLAWGLLSTAMFLVKSAEVFYILRFLLGVAEAGFFPGVLVLINRWFPAGRRGRITAIFAISVPLAGVIGAPVSGNIIEYFHSFYGLHGWQWMFIIEGLPVLILALIILIKLPDNFHVVPWLTNDEKNYLADELNAEGAAKQPISSFRSVLVNGNIWIMVAIYFAAMLAVNTINYWMPTIIHGAGVGRDSLVGYLVALPFLAGTIFMVLTGISSDYFRERRWHLIVPLVMAAGGMVIVGTDTNSLLIVMIGFTIAAMGAVTTLPMFWQLPGPFLPSHVLAAAIAMISSLGNIAAFLAPYLIGFIRDQTHNTGLALFIISGMMMIGVIFILLIPASVVNPRKESGLK